jgi:3'-phosphoadenosine 5'-phosphosulfate sulfotransferase (PAPS reductase)/FAD synthetase
MVDHDDPQANEVTHNGAPDRFLMVSGGMDSVAMAVYVMEEVLDDDWGAWNKRPNVLYLDTTLGLSSQHLYVKMLCDYYEWPLITVRTPFDFEEHTEEKGFYKPNKHDMIFNSLKGLPAGRISTMTGNPHFYFGGRRAESRNRRDIERFTYRDKGDIRGWHHNPIYDWEDEDVVQFIKDRDIPYNPNWDDDHFTDCGCGATATHEELIELEAEGYAIMSHKLRRLEERVERDDDRDVWAPHSFDPENAEERFEASSLMCGPNCGGKSKALGDSIYTDNVDVDVRYVCPDCEQMFVIRDNAMNHDCDEESETESGGGIEA